MFIFYLAAFRQQIQPGSSLLAFEIAVKGSKLPHKTALFIPFLKPF